MLELAFDDPTRPPVLLSTPVTAPVEEELSIDDETGELVDPPVLIRLLIVDAKLRVELFAVTASNLPTKPPT